MAIHIINGQQVEVKEPVDHYIIKKKPSSNVDYFGIGPAGEVFLQFANGKSYIYSDVPEETRTEMLEAESIGKFVSARIVKAYKGLQHDRLVEPVKQAADEQA